ncbi:MAG: hypothetical protein Q27BPR15_07260 [Rhodobacter sp. CACIA14H1]|nr:MAG: hypothetical protein Q27BPR15_07260 [Rhodobacter sp. CACIA14H1]
MTLKSVEGWPFMSTALTAMSPGKATGRRGRQSSAMPSPDRRKPGPVRTVRFRSMPGKREKGPSSATVAMDSRQSIAPSRSARASSTVTPLPFFHGWRV